METKTKKPSAIRKLKKEKPTMPKTKETPTQLDRFLAAAREAIANGLEYPEY